MEVKLSFAQLLCCTREKYNLTQRDLASKLPYTHAFVGLLETGQRLPSVKIAIEIANALHEDVYLFALEALADKLTILIEKELDCELSDLEKAALRDYVDARFGKSLLALIPKSTSSSKSA